MESSTKSIKPSLVKRRNTAQDVLEEAGYPFDMAKESEPVDEKLKGLPRGIIQARSDLELKPLWSSSSLRSKGVDMTNRNLLAIPVGIKQKSNVDAIVKKFLPANFTVVLFHYDGNMDQWSDLEWSSKAIHIVAMDQTKWWFAKRFLHPDVVFIYDYIFIWDEDLGVENFTPERFVEGMAPVFSRAAWFCTWNLIQNDLVHGWGMDMKLGYCAQGDRTKNVGIVDSEYIFHQGIQTLGESVHFEKKRHGHDSRTLIRRQSTWELQTFEERWNKAVEEDKNWINPSSSSSRKKRESNGNNRRLRRGNILTR
ncbi:hypothetical protein N665_0115s0109 [Sinapis alba]|nr:hypothetical protein N665_0115s0109 [Sinapis alba]